MNISSSTYSSPVNSDFPLDSIHPRKDFKALQSALKAGNFADAQTALTALKNDFAAQPQMAMSSSVDNAKITDDVTALENALASNDREAAHAAIKTLRQDLILMRPGKQGDTGGPLPPLPAPADTDPAVTDSGSMLDTQA